MLAAAQTQDTVSSRHAPAMFAVADEGMGQDEAMEFLTDAERAAMGESDEPVAESTDPGDAGDEDSGKPQDKEQSNEDGRAEDGEPEADGQHADGQAETALAATDDQQAAPKEGDGEDRLTVDSLVPDTTFVPQYQFDAGDLEARQKELDTNFANAKATIEKAYADGEIDDADYQRRRDMLWEIRFKEQGAIDRDRIKAEISRETSEQSKAQSWEHSLARFMAQNEDIRSSRILTGAMQAELNAIGAEAAGKNLSYNQMLELAKARVYKELGIAKPAQAQATKPKVDPVKELVKQRGKKPAIPQTLGDVPSDMVSGGKFDDINSLSGLAYEDAIARMSADELAQWSR